MSSQLLHAVKEKNDAEIVRMGDDLALGKAKDYADYKFVCGIARGLMVANNHLLELDIALREDEDVE